jgi:hypothetical protein
MFKDLRAGGIDGVIVSPEQLSLAPAARRTELKLLARLNALSSSTTQLLEAAPDAVLLEPPLPSPASLAALSGKLPLVAPCDSPSAVGAQLAACVEDSLSSHILALLSGPSPQASPSAFARALRTSLLARPETSWSALLHHGPSQQSVQQIASTQALSTSSAELRVRTAELARMAAVLQATLPCSPVYRQTELQVLAQEPSQDKQLLRLRRQLLELRRQSPALRLGGYAIVIANDEDSVLSYARIQGKQGALVLVNTASHPREVSVPGSRLVARGLPPGTRLYDQTPGEAGAQKAVSPSQLTLTTGSLSIFLAPRTAALYTSQP